MKFNFKADDCPTSNPGFRHSAVTMAGEEGEESELEGEARREGVTNPLRVKADTRASEEDRGEGVVSYG